MVILPPVTPKRAAGHPVVPKLTLGGLTPGGSAFGGLTRSTRRSLSSRSGAPSSHTSRSRPSRPADRRHVTASRTATPRTDSPQLIRLSRLALALGCLARLLVRSLTSQTRSAMRARTWSSSCKQTSKPSSCNSARLLRPTQLHCTSLIVSVQDGHAARASHTAWCRPPP